MKTMRDLLIDAVALVAYLIVANPSVTGLPVHEWLSVGVLVVVLVHFVVHWDWTADAVKRFFARLSAASRMNLVIDAVLFVAFVVCMLSGFMVSRHVLMSFGYVAQGYFVWNPMHSISATTLLAAMLVHLAAHWKWIVMAVRTKVVPRLGRGAETTAEEA